MKRKIIGNIEPKCIYCTHGKISSDGKSVLCHKKGVVDKDFSCKKFSYDPIKRIPERKPELQQFTAEDFEF